MNLNTLNHSMTGGGAGDAPLKVVQGTALSQVSGSTQVAVTVTVPGVSEILFRGMRLSGGTSYAETYNYIVLGYE